MTAKNGKKKLSPGAARRIAGCDLGKAVAKFAIGVVEADGRVTIESTEHVAHEGQPMKAFVDWYHRAGVASCAALGATGIFADEFVMPVVAGLPESACLEAALPRLGVEGPLNVITVGARGYGVLTRNADGRVQFLSNDKCSSGTGETMVKIAGRFGLKIDEASSLACAADTAIPITARCSVFAKSEMTHFGNQGYPADQLFKGYFGSVANYVAALLARVRVDGPVFVTGGASRIGSLVSSLSVSVGEEVVVPDEALHLEAVGAVLLTAEQLTIQTIEPLPADPETLIEPRDVQLRELGAARLSAGRTTRLKAPPIPEGAEEEPSILGLDLGSTGSKAVLTSIATGEIVLDLYDRTRGNPVEAALRLVSTLLAQTDCDVRAVGVTGSGREAVATVLRAAFPEMVDHVVVVNEIVAHATAAIRCDDKHGESISVVEIGGQDAKFIQIVGGQIVESDMNRACSAGTGSFLEEQAVFYGVRDIEEFTTMAAASKRPPDLGQMCTVFVADAAAEAHNEGYAVEDLFSGFQYSVIHNYINRVMGQRTFGDRIFFQGKPASGESLPWTLAAVTGREVIVPPNPGAMGAWGIGLCARRSLGIDALAAAPAFELTGLLGAQVVARHDIQCRDKKCATLCNIEKTTVEVRGTRQIVLSGGACSKYEVSTAVRPKLAKDAPSAFDERAALLAPYLEPGDHDPSSKVIALPLVGAVFGHVPWLVTLLRELGFSVRVPASDSRSLARGEERCYAFDTCAPTKIAHGVAACDADLIFLPKILSVGDRGGDGGTTCPMEQGMPEMIRESLAARGQRSEVVHPLLSFREGFTSMKLALQVFRSLNRLGARRRDLVPALTKAAIAQEAFEHELAAIGRRTLVYGRQRDIPVIAVCGNLHVIHEPEVNARIPGLLRGNGVLALPMDCYPIPSAVPRMPRMAWGESNRALRVAVAARQRGGVYPLLLSSFGCGPASFVEQIFAALMDGYPFTSLETDGHGGTAGYVTRVQAFLHTVRSYDGGATPAPRQRLELLAPLRRPPLDTKRDAQLVFLPIADRLSPIVAASYRAFGFDAVASPANSAETFAAGRRDCSGKECVPYQLVWGGFRTHLDSVQAGKKTVLLQVSGDGRCRNCMFSIKDQLSLERMGRSKDVSIRHYGDEPEIGPDLAARAFVGTVAWDLVNQMASYYRPVESRPGQVDELYARFGDEVERCVEQPAQSKGRIAGIWELTKVCADSMERASAAFADVAAQAESPSGLRTVLLTGDIYVRLDPFASGGLVRKLNQRGLRVIMDPASSLTEYLAEERLNEILGLRTDILGNFVDKHAMRTARRYLQARVRALHPWLPAPDTKPIIEASRRLLDKYPQGEAPITIGSVLHYWDLGVCDGVVVANPWGCAPALVSEALLRHRTEIPMLFVYRDGSPLDERKLNGFAFKLRRSTPVASGSAPWPATLGLEARIRSRLSVSRA